MKIFPDSHKKTISALVTLALCFSLFGYEYLKNSTNKKAYNKEQITNQYMEQLKKCESDNLKKVNVCFKYLLNMYTVPKNFFPDYSLLQIESKLFKDSLTNGLSNNEKIDIVNDHFNNYHTFLFKRYSAISAGSFSNKMRYRLIYKKYDLIFIKESLNSITEIEKVYIRLLETCRHCRSQLDETRKNIELLNDKFENI